MIRLWKRQPPTTVVTTGFSSDLNSKMGEAGVDERNWLETALESEFNLTRELAQSNSLAAGEEVFTGSKVPNNWK